MAETPEMVERRPLSKAALDARRPPPPGLLLEAVWDRPDIPAKARVAHALRVPRIIDAALASPEEGRN